MLIHCDYVIYSSSPKAPPLQAAGLSLANKVSFVDGEIRLYDTPVEVFI